MRFFVVSAHGLVVTNNLGIWLYHIPELRAAEDDSRLIPVWDWSGDASEYRGTLYSTASPHPALWLQGYQDTHILEFDVDESGCFPVVVNHHRTGGRPAYYVGEYPKLRGRKGMSIDVGRRDEIVLINTGVLGKPDITRRLRAPIRGLYDNNGSWRRQHEVKYTDLDEMTGRIMIAVGPGRMGGMSLRGSDWDEAPCARRLYIGDLPI